MDESRPQAIKNYFLFLVKQHLIQLLLLLLLFYLEKKKQNPNALVILLYIIYFLHYIIYIYSFYLPTHVALQKQVSTFAHFSLRYEF